MQLFEMGWGFVAPGSPKPMRIKPSKTLLKADYGVLVAKYATTRPMPPAAEWMTMSAIRDDRNNVLPYSGKPDSDVAAINMPHEVADWLTATGNYFNVRNETNVVLSKPGAHALGLTPGANHDVALLISVEMLSQSAAFPSNLFPNHYIGLDTPSTPWNAFSQILDDDQTELVCLPSSCGSP
jgi:hypothetical protein